MEDPRLRVVGDDEYRVLIPAFLAARVIGTGAATIKKIKEAVRDVDATARIMVYHTRLNGEPLMEGAADRVLSIRGCPEALEIAISNLIPLVQFPSKKEKVKLELRLMIPFHCCAALVGNKGANIKKIQDETGTFIQTYKTSLPHSQERLVRIQHFEAAKLCSTALQIWKSIAPFKKEKPVVFYEPLWFEPGTFGNTGSFMDTRFFNAHGVFSKTPYVGPPKEEAPNDGFRGGPRGGFRGAPRGGPRGGFRVGPMGGTMGGPMGGPGNSVYKYPPHGADSYTEISYEEEDACLEGSNIALDAFDEKPALDTDQYADAIAKGIALGMKQAMAMFGDGSLPMVQRGALSGSRGAGRSRAGFRGGRAASAGFRSTPY